MLGNYQINNPIFSYKLDKVDNYGDNYRISADKRHLAFVPWEPARNSKISITRFLSNASLCGCKNDTFFDKIFQ